MNMDTEKITAYADCATFNGLDRNGCYEFRGIPFAKAPVGDLAFRKPLPYEFDGGVFDAVRGRANPVQIKGHRNIVFMDEDCLYLNIFIPKSAYEEGKFLPVIVWFYGGSYNTGGSGLEEEGRDDLVWEMSFFARQTESVVVSFNYRLNAYGFMYLHGLDPERFDSNIGLYDQIAALRFVKENIKAFGGDPANIMCAGQSAGAAAILALAGSDEAGGLFNKAFMQSPNAGHFWSPEEATKICKKTLKFMGADPGNAKSIFALTQDEIIAGCNRMKKLFYRKGIMTCPYSPVIDGDLLKKMPVEAVRDKDIKIVIGNNSEDAYMFTRAFSDPLMPFLSRLLKVKPAKDIQGTYRDRLVYAMTDELYRRHIMDIAANYKGHLWVYEYSFVTDEMKKDNIPPMHAVELSPQFGIKDDYCDPLAPETGRAGGAFRKLYKDLAHDSMSYPEYKENHAKIVIR